MLKKLILFLIAILLNYKAYKNVILQVFGRLRFVFFPYTCKAPKISSARGFLSKLQQGDILLKGYEGKPLQRLLVPNKKGYTVAGIYTGCDTVITTEDCGVVQMPVHKFCVCDKLCVIRPCHYRAAAVGDAFQYVGTPYDFHFQTGQRTLYSFELCVACYKKIHWTDYPLKVLGIPLPRFMGSCYMDQTFLSSDKGEIEVCR